MTCRSKTFSHKQTDRIPNMNMTAATSSLIGYRDGTGSYMKVIGRVQLNLPRSKLRGVQSVCEVISPALHTCRESVWVSAYEPLFVSLDVSGQPSSPDRSAPVVVCKPIRCRVDVTGVRNTLGNSLRLSAPSTGGGRFGLKQL
ncbi:hypothetical protein EYF80_054197 [Liparis tanakae]|uniref:Uncharacterized protein n=1 Tax=Liparis tanakae TaxID=230148 RepID=A0A4Z2F3A6_9TELE|nr:hypothetical protein EYF80_054197 [Liparis tanakae]